MKALFAWLDENPAMYGWIGVAAMLPLATWLAIALRREERAPRPSEFGVVAALFLLVIVGWRWPALLEIREVGAEEARLVAAALSLEQPSGLTFRRVDPLDGGPIPLLALWPTHALGVPQDYFNARLVALLMDWGSLVLGFRLLWRRFTTAAAAIGMLPGLMIFAGVTEERVAVYSASHAILLIAMTSLWLLFRARRKSEAGERAALAWVAAGFVAGLLAWCGREAQLWMGAVGATALGLLMGKAAAIRSRAAGFGWLTAGAAYAWALGWCWLHGIGQVEAFWIRYTHMSVGRSSAIAAAALPWRGWIATGMALMVWALTEKTAHLKVASRWGAWAVGVATVVGGAVDENGSRALFWWAPLLTIAGAVAIGAVLEHRRFGWVAMGFALVGAGVPVAASLAEGAPAIFGKFAEYWRHPRGETAEVIAKFAREGDTMTVWGWRPSLHVETRLPQAVRSTVSGREVDAGEHPAYFRQRYMKDFRENLPAFFVDAVAPGAFRFGDRETQGHEVFAELRDVVRYEYVLIEETPDARIYMNLDQVGARNPRRRGAVPLVPETMTRAEAGIPLNPLSETRLLAHAPSVLEHPVPAGADWLRGGFGIMADAYQNPEKATDGALFAVDVIDARGRRERRFARTLDPMGRAEDRGTFEFTVDLRGADATAVQLVTEAGAKPDYDWTYWESLRFEGEILP